MKSPGAMAFPGLFGFMPNWRLGWAAIQLNAYCVSTLVVGSTINCPSVQAPGVTFPLLPFVVSHMFESVARAVFGMNHGLTHKSPVALAAASAIPVAPIVIVDRPKIPAKNVGVEWLSVTVTRRLAVSIDTVTSEVGTAAPWIVFCAAVFLALLVMASVSACPVRFGFVTNSNAPASAAASAARCASV